MKNLTKLTALVVLVSVNILTPFSYADVEFSENILETPENVEVNSENENEEIPNDNPNLQQVKLHTIRNVTPSNPLDIIIEATATQANQTLKINKYFANAYTVSRCEGCETSIYSSEMGERNPLAEIQPPIISHTYEEPGIYTITLSLTGGADRWTFNESNNKPLVPKDGTTMTGVKIIYMPSLADGFGDHTNHFFAHFNSNGALTSLPDNSFDTSNIVSVGVSFFEFFNSNGSLTNLPEGSFNISKITQCHHGFFNAFNYNGSLTSLPEGSFDTSGITIAGSNFFGSFNYSGALTILPNSFTLNSTGAKNEGGYANAFNSSYTLNRNVSDLVAGVTAPTSDRNTFSDNQPGRCGVKANRLVTPAGRCGGNPTVKKLDGVPQPGTREISGGLLECNISDDLADEIYDRISVDTVNNQCIITLEAGGYEFSMLAANLGATEIGTGENSYGVKSPYPTTYECPSGYHLPSRAERHALRLAIRKELGTTGASSAEGVIWKMVLPGAGYLADYMNPDSILGMGDAYMYSNTSEGNTFRYIMVDSNGVWTPLFDHNVHAVSLRCFKDSDPVDVTCGSSANTCNNGFADDSSSDSVGTYWQCRGVRGGDPVSCNACIEGYTFNGTKCEYNCINENGKDWNPETQKCECPASVNGIPITTIKDQCTVSIHVSDTKDVVMMAANVGAISIGTTTASAGKRFQWGNNEGIISSSDEGFKPNVGNRDWVNPQDDTLWGGQGDDPGGVRGAEIKDSGNLREERQGPCPHGFHIPSHGEWEELSNYRRAGHWLENEAFMPRVGVIGYDGMEWTYRTVANPDSWYWSSSRRGAGCVEGKCASYLQMPLNDTWSSLPAMERGTALQVRCIMNTDDPDRKVTFKLDNKEKEITVEDYTRLMGYPEEFEKEGYDIVSDDYNLENPTPIIADTIINLRYVAQKFTVTFDSDGGDQIDPIIVNYGEQINAPTPTKECNNFVKWDNLPETMPANNITVKAIWNYTCNKYSGGGRKGDIINKNQHQSADENTSTIMPTENTKNDKSDKNNYDSKYTQEENEAYNFAHKNGITTMPTIQKSAMNSKITRIEMAKMLSQYAMNVLGKQPDISKGAIKFNDVTEKMDRQYDNGVTIAYQLGIMGQNMKNNRFRPNDEVTRAEFATALSRLLYSTSDGQYKSTKNYYELHMNKLKKEGIITNDNPNMKELRGYIMIMLMRSAK